MGAASCSALQQIEDNALRMTSSTKQDYTAPAVKTGMTKEQIVEEMEKEEQFVDAMSKELSGVHFTLGHDNVELNSTQRKDYQPFDKQILVDRKKSIEENKRMAIHLGGWFVYNDKTVDEWRKTALKTSYERDYKDRSGQVAPTSELTSDIRKDIQSSHIRFDNTSNFGYGDGEPHFATTTHLAFDEKPMEAKDERDKMREKLIGLVRNSEVVFGNDPREYKSTYQATVQQSATLKSSGKMAEERRKEEEIKKGLKNALLSTSVVFSSDCGEDEMKRRMRSSASEDYRQVVFK